MKSKTNLKLDIDEGPLNSWFRQQGGRTKSDFTGQSVKSNQNFILPNIKNSIKQRKDNDNNCSVHNSKNFLSASEYSVSFEENKRKCKTPKDSSYHQKCIEDVYNCNKPNNFNFRIPRELTYVRSIPNIKYITVCSGKSFKSIWQLVLINKK